ncbi:MAG TPA: hypothetical protein VEN30_14270 [Paraburkholderia sp.]|nr:hypothetical protein [Paraburkholderia sp.]
MSMHVCVLGGGAYSRELVDELLRDEQLDFDFHHSGKLVVYRDARELTPAGNFQKNR